MITENIEKYATSKGLAISKIEDTLSIGRGTLSKTINKHGSIGSAILENFLKHYDDVNPAWLVTGDGEMLKNQIPAITTLKVSKGQQVPFYDNVASAGKVILFKDFSLSNAKGYISVPNMPKCDGAVPIVGDSMYPLLKSGDIVCYKLKDPGNIIYGEMYLIDWHDGDGDDYLMAKFIAKSTEKNHIKLVSHNKHHDDLEISKDNIRQLALIKLSVRFNTH
jgi:phage repressor protein C with HTH and peptisase S24 domain